MIQSSQVGQIGQHYKEKTHTFQFRQQKHRFQERKGGEIQRTDIQTPDRMRKGGEPVRSGGEADRQVVPCGAVGKTRSLHLLHLLGKTLQPTYKNVLLSH